MKESPKKDKTGILDKIDLDAGTGGRSRIAGVPLRVFGIIKFILGVCLLPFVYAVSAAFLNEFGAVEKTAQRHFWAGVISFVTLYFFIYEPVGIYNKGQRLLEAIFQFFKPLLKVAPYLLPIYSIVIFILYLLFSSLFKEQGIFTYFIFLFSFSLALHLVFSARSIRSKQGDFLRANYIFGFSFIYIIDLMLLSFCLNLIFKEFSFVNFFNNSFQIGKNIFYAIFKQLFLR